MATHAGNDHRRVRAHRQELAGHGPAPRFERPTPIWSTSPCSSCSHYLRANGFKTYIVSGGGIEFMRALAEDVYGIPPEQVIGSSIKTKFEMRDGKPVIVRLPEIDFIDDKAGKPVGINQHIGRRPIAAFGNSDGDLQMLQWTAAGEGPRFCSARPPHRRRARVGLRPRIPRRATGQGLDEAERRGWTVVDMKQDWKTIFPSL